MTLLRFYLANEVQSSGEERRTPHRDRPPRPLARRHRQRHRARGGRHRTRSHAAFAHCRRLFRARRHPQCRGEGRRADQPHPRSLLAARHRRGRLARRRPHHPHQRREAAVGLPAVGRRLMPSCTSPSGCGPNSRRAISPRRSHHSTAASAASVAYRQSCRRRCLHSPVCDARHRKRAVRFQPHDWRQSSKRSVRGLG